MGLVHCSIGSHAIVWKFGVDVEVGGRTVVGCLIPLSPPGSVSYWYNNRKGGVGGVGSSGP